MEPVHERQELKEYYQDSDRAEAYVADRFLAPRGRVIHETQVALVNDLIASARFESALELAPGPGRLTRDIRGLKRGVAVDASPQMLAEASKVVDDRIWELREGDIFELELGERFPLIYSFRFIRHLKDAQRATVFARVQEHLEPGGIFLFDAPNVVVEGPIRQRKPECFPVYDMLWDEQKLIAELSEAGFTVDRLVGNMKWHGVQRVVSRLTPRALNRLGATVVAAMDRLPGTNPLEWVVVCRG